MGFEEMFRDYYTNYHADLVTGDDWFYIYSPMKDTTDTVFIAEFYCSQPHKLQTMINSLYALNYETYMFGISDQHKKTDTIKKFLVRLGGTEFPAMAGY